jgi:hypothetical protein
MQLTHAVRRRGRAGKCLAAPRMLICCREPIQAGDEIMERFCLIAAVTLAAHAPLAVPAGAQNWPTRPLTLVVPFAAGGPSDVAGRIIAQRLGEVLGQQVIVENPREGRGERSGRAAWLRPHRTAINSSSATSAPTRGARPSTGSLHTAR